MITSDSRALTERKAVVWVVRALSYLVYFYLIVVEIVLFIGFFLLLFGANPSAGFTQWAYRNLDRVMAPFRGIFTPIQLGTTTADVQATFDTSVLFAMIIYGIVALIFSALIGWLSGRLGQIYSAEAEIEREAEVAAQQAAAQAAVAQQAAVPPTTATPTAQGPATPPPPSV
ncbi:MAG: hypothetical protein E4H05_04755 [Acidimicrobiales bacterium]|nr:MAG: hypothetical protein E4H05_04755 [Acidimicrobiales bacterium]